MTARWLSPIFVVAGLSCWRCSSSAPGQSLPPSPIFARTSDALKLLETRCLQCHDARKKRGGLDLSTREKLLHGGESGAVVIAGSSKKSLLLRLVRHEQEPNMPRQAKKLSDAQIALLAAWIDAGSPYDRTLGKGDDLAWWSLQPVGKPMPPTVDAKCQEWVRNPIDAFVLAKLQAAALEPSPVAEPRVLIRRLYFDLLGLPPTPKEVDEFVAAWDGACAKRQAIYERVVDRLLQSPHYGERWARHWMDVIHFAETHGHDQDVPRENAWPYRDYLIQSFNSDKPYARFVEEQIAGDILYPDDPQATLALGFLAAGPWDESSLRDIREDSLDRKAGQYIDRDDMVGTVGLAFLSTTVQCARCHDHKFDPISQKEYYGLQAVFAGVDRANRALDIDPAARAKRLALQRRKQELHGGPAVAARLLKDPTVAADIATWEQSLTKKAGWKVLDPLEYKSAEGSTLTKQPDGSLLAGGKKPERDTYTIEAVSTDAQLAALRLETLTDDSLPHRGPGRQDNGNLHLSEIKIEAAPAGEPTKRQPIAVVRALADFNQDGWDIAKAIDGQRGTAWGIYPAVGKPHAAVFVFKEPVRFPGGARLIVTLEQLHGGGHLIGRPRLSATSAAVTAAEITLQPLPANIQNILAKPAQERNDSERAVLAHYALTQKVEADLAAMPKPQLVYAAASDFQPDGSFRPAAAPRPIHVLKRGDIRFPLEPAVPGALSCLTSLDGAFRLADPNREGQRRAALAKWVSDPKNPLTWRSIVNRVWHYHFGRGLVATPSDFGRLGATPSHPELLDWLTATFQEDGGSLKKLHRRIVTSATYLQASRHREDAAKLDADNVLLWRQNVQRLDAESVRDAVLQVAGKLDPTMGGPSVKHFKQSPGIHRTPKVEYEAFDPDAPGAHRRSVYRFIFRTVPDPFMDALDCPDASQFAATRTVSLTALQALALLNDPFMVRMSEHFAKSIEGVGDVKEQVRHAYRLAVNRDPMEREELLLVQFANRHGVANACRVLLNSNEFAFVP
jgi:cytochrome c553